MIPLLTYPLALIALATVPALAAIYILRNRFRRRQVSSLVLWRFHVQSKSGGAKIHRLQLPLLFFLELLALLLLVAAATGPRWKLPQSSRPLIVVLNDGFSMRAVQDGVSSQDRAKEFLAKLFRRQPPPFTRLILAGTEPHALGSTVKTWNEVNNLLPQWKCWSPQAAMDSAITLASELGGGQANILVLTDHKPSDEKISSPRLEWHAFGEPVDNFAIINASRTAFGDQDRCLLEIANDSDAAHSTRLLVQTGSNAIQSSEISLGPRQSQRIVFNIPSTAPALRATLDPDALAADNEVELLPPIRKHVRVEVALTNKDLSVMVNRALDATGFRATLEQNPQLVIHSDNSPVSSNAWDLVWSTAAATNAYTGPFIVDNSHPLAEGIALEGVIWAAAAATNAPGDEPVVMAGNVPLLSEREDFLGRRHITLNLNPALSTVEDTPDWPILFWDILSWRISEMPGLKESNARLGTEVILKTDGQPIAITQPDGGSTSFPNPGDELAIDTPIPGIYSVAMGSETNQFSVNALDADESDLSQCGTGQWGKWSDDPGQRLVETSAVWIFGLLALAFLAGHMYFVAAAQGRT
ncbi:MAG TPA: BatA domain-containing protein [Candidatus Sulfotelmatobacter sp.]|nr:BatA domain-containing protein [Candidatus Sulfotelmatobacter sp.]